MNTTRTYRTDDASFRREDVTGTHRGTDALASHRQWDMAQALLLAWGHGRDGAEIDALTVVTADGYPAAAATLLALG